MRELFFFLQTHKISNIGKAEALLCEIEYSNYKKLPTKRIEHGTYDFKSETLLSDLPSENFGNFIFPPINHI